MLLTDDNKDELMLNLETRSKEFRERRREYRTRRISKKEFSGETEDGWSIYSELKTSFSLRKEKPRDEIFEDKIWQMFHKMGVRKLSSGRNLKVSYGKEVHETQQIDVLAIDDGVAFVIECKKSLSSGMTKGGFKKDIEAMVRRKDGIRKELRKLYGRGLQVGFIFATEGYQISTSDLQRLEDERIYHFSESETKYYEMLTSQLGTASRYQLFADIFPNREIDDFDNRVYALEGKMGGHTYYTFNVEPQKLLRISYVLHRSKVQAESPSYQRVVKRSRLKKIQSFVNDGGYFPNSLIINLSNQKKLKFDPAELTLPSSSNRAGVLHLPKQLRSAYIIDGQHRLYGYSDSKFSNKNTIPVVAFVGLERQEQLQIFVDINENQKAVPANLRLSLEEDLFASSDIQEEKVKGLRASIISRLGEDKTSPLFDRVLLGEDPKTDKRIISVLSMIQGLNRSKLLPEFKKNLLVRPGAFDDHNLKASSEKVYRILNQAFNYLQDNAQEEWEKKQLEKGLITVPNGINALLSIIGDLTYYLLETKSISSTKSSAEEIGNALEEYLDTVVALFKELPFEQRQKLASEKGGGAPMKIQNTIRLAINERFPDFNPEGLESFIKQQDSQFNAETLRICAILERDFRQRVREGLAHEFGAKDWHLRGVPKKIWDKLVEKHTDELREERATEEDSEPWDFTDFSDLRTIILEKWTIFEKDFMLPGSGNIAKTKKTEWMVKLKDIRNPLAHNRQNASEEDYQIVKAIEEWQLNDNSGPLSELEI